ncbi:hypothetical protein [Winogradskyella pulchriflava]|uniref:Uncharacterized protein n=1 Tax=Winogradskyella pulchriflava TaxID=1110688 RepID=A0ABV6QC99_9FLAO
MFVSTESLGEIQKLHFNDKSFPMGSKPERYARQFLELSVSPKGKLAYKIIFDMTEEKDFVTNAVCVMVTPTQKAFIEYLLLNAEDLQQDLLDALTRATYMCEFELSKDQLRSDFNLQCFLKHLQQFSNSQNQDS